MEPTTTAVATTATATTATGASGLSMNAMLLAMLAFFAIMIFMQSRSQKKRDAEQKKQLASLQKGDKVVITGGIVGTIVGFNQDIFEVKVSENTKLSVLSGGIVSVLKDNKINNGANK